MANGGGLVQVATCLHGQGAQSPSPARVAPAFCACCKRNQAKAENLSREILIAEELSAERLTAILSASAEMDRGVSFISVAPLRPV